MARRETWDVLESSIMVEFQQRYYSPQMDRGRKWFSIKIKERENFLKFLLPVIVKNICTTTDMLLTSTGIVWEMPNAFLSQTSTLDFHNASSLKRQVSGWRC